MIAKGEQIISVPVFTVFIWQPWEHCVGISRYTNTVTHLAPALLSPHGCDVTNLRDHSTQVTGWRVWKWWIIDPDGVNSWYSHNKTDTGKIFYWPEKYLVTAEVESDMTRWWPGESPPSCPLTLARTQDTATWHTTHFLNTSTPIPSR